MDPIGNLKRTLQDAQSTMDAIKPEDLSKPTPCGQWDVRTLANHMVETAQMFTRAIGGQPMVIPGGETDHVGDDPASAFAKASDDLVQAWSAPGALDRTIQMFGQERPAAMGIGIVTADELLHTWDLAKALGRPIQLNQESAEATYAMMKQMMGGFERGPDKAFDVEVPCPEDAPIQDRLVAFSGRAP